MFTGIVQAVGVVTSVGGGQLVVDQKDFWPNDPWILGESVAVDGVCLTMVSSANGLAFDVSEETLSRSTLGRLELGSSVNLERALRPEDRLGGHFVQGHVDGVGKVVGIEELEGSWLYRFSAPEGGAQYLTPKGSITVSGVSLTIIDPVESEFSVAVVPHTYSSTSMNQWQVGSEVNIEFDMLAKYLETLMAHR